MYRFLLALLSVVTLALAAPEDGLVLNLPFDGDVAMTVGAGTVDVVGTPEYVPGKHGQAIKLTGKTNLQIPIPENVGRGEFTITFWLQPLWHAKDGIDHPILDIPAAPEKYDSVGWAVGQLVLSKGWSETISPDYLYGVVDSDQALARFAPGKWIHVAIVWNVAGGYWASYVDGVGRRRPAQEMQRPDAAGNVMYLASRYPRHGGGDIVVDDLRVYARPLEPAELEQVAGEAYPPPGPPDWRLAGQVDPAKAVETPHVTWAKPYAGGRPRVAVVAEQGRGRDMIELAERLDMDLVPIVGPPVNTHTLLNADFFHAVGSELESALAAEPRVNCVVVASFGWNLFTDATRQAVMDFVNAGGGLLFVGPRTIGEPGVTENLGAGIAIGWQANPLGHAIEELVGRLPRVDEEYLTAGIPWQTVDLFKDILSRKPVSTLFRGGDYGNGRILVYDIRTGGAHSRAALTPAVEYARNLDPFEYDYAIGATARAVLWAAGWDSPVRFGRLAWHSRQFVRATPIGMAGSWRVEVLNLQDEAVRATIHMEVRGKGPAAPAVADRGVNLQPGMNVVEIPYTTDRLGEVFGDFRLIVDGAAADWGSATLDVAHGNPWFAGVTADRQTYPPGSPPYIVAQLANKSYGVHFGLQGELTWRLYDNWGRLIARDSRTVDLPAYDQDTAPVSFSLPELPPGNTLCRLVVDLARRGRAADQATLVLRRESGPQDDLLLTMWSGVGSITDTLALGSMRDRYGVDCGGVNPSGQPLNENFARDLDTLTAMNLRPWIYAAHLGGGATKPEHTRAVDVCDDGFVRSLRQHLHDTAAIAKPYDPVLYSLGDEVNFWPTDGNPSGPEQGAFQTWLRVRYGKIEALNERWGTEYKHFGEVWIPQLQGRLGEVNGKLWHDLNLFRHDAYCAAVAAGVAGAREVDPDAKVGTEGIFGLTHAYGAFDYAKVTRVSTLMGQYALGQELDMVRSLNDPGDAIALWYNYAKMDRGYSLYGPWHTVLRGATNFMWYTAFEGSHYSALNPDFTAFDQWQWTWSELQPLKDGLGKLIMGVDRDDYGVRIIYEHRNLNRVLPMFHAMLVTTTLLEDLGIQYDFIRATDVAAGALQRQGARVIMLPGQFVMDPDVAAGIRAFVEAGGAAYADLQPGQSDGYERYQPASPLADVFVPPGALPADAASWAAHRRDVGAGHTLLLGNYPSLYMRERYAAGGANLRAGIAAFLKDVGVAPTFSVTTREGDFVPVTVVGYHDGGSHYVGLQRGYKIADQAPRTLVVRGPEAHVYDARAGKYLGKSAAVEVSMEVACGTMLAFLPYRVTDLAIPGLREAYRLGDPIRCRTSLVVEGDRPDGGVVRVAVADGNGDRIPALCRKVRSDGGVAELSLGTAYNDAPGAWSLTFTDVATGATVTRIVQLTE